MSDLFAGLQLNLSGLSAGLIAGGVCSILGVYVVLKRIVFVGVSLAQVSSAGVALAFLIGTRVAFVAEHPLGLSLAATLVGIAVFSQQRGGRLAPPESAIGIGYLLASALTLMFLVQSPKGAEEVKELLDGHLATVDRAHLMALTVMGALVLAVHGLFYKQILFVSFDREMAEALGYRARAWELLFYLTLGAAIAVSVQCAGLLAVFAYLVMPAVTGLQVGRSMRSVFLVALLTGLFSTVAGFGWSLVSDLPTSPPTIAVQAGCLAVAALARHPLGRSHA